MFVLFLNFSSRFNRIKKHNNTIEVSSNIENKDHFTFLLFKISLRLKNSKRKSCPPPCQIWYYWLHKIEEGKGGAQIYKVMFQG